MVLKQICGQKSGYGPNKDLFSRALKRHYRTQTSKATDLTSQEMTSYQQQKISGYLNKVTGSYWESLNLGFLSGVLVFV